MKYFTALFFSFSLFLGACSQEEDLPTASPSDSAAQSIGDVMAGIDGSGGSDGGYSFAKAEQMRLASVEKSFGAKNSENTLKSRAACSETQTFSSCSNNVIVRDFAGCTIGNATFEGDVTMTFTDAGSDNTCALASNGHYVERVPNYTITGERGGSYTVAVTQGSQGQRVERTASGFDFSNAGIRRILRFNNVTLADFTSSTTSNIAITGATRDGRVANGGTLRVLNNDTQESCDFSPDQVTWTANCNCATSGTWNISCSSGESGTYEISSCGQGTMTLDGETETVSMDICQAQN